MTVRPNKETIVQINPTVFERHAQTVLVLILVALLLWVGDTTQSTSLSVAEMRVEIAYMKHSVETPSPQYAEMSKRLDAFNQRALSLERAILLQEKTTEENRR